MPTCKHCGNDFALIQFNAPGLTIDTVKIWCNICN